MSLILAIVFEDILRLLVLSQKTRYLPERASCEQTQTHHLIIHQGRRRVFKSGPAEVVIEC